MILGGLSFFIVSFITVSHLPSLPMGISHEKTKAAAVTRQIHMGIEAYHREYGKYPKELIELDGKNERKKVYFEGIKEVDDKYGIYFAVDEDFDGFIETDEGELKQKVAVWTYLPDRTMIKSWEK